MPHTSQTLRALWPLALLALFGLWMPACANEAGTIVTSGNRYVIPATEEPLVQCLPTEPPRKWAVVIGVNWYKDERIPDLGGAVNDAWAFYHYMASPSGGGVNPYRLKLLLNDEATRENVEGALGNFLGQACPQDQVIIYFAGHGAPEPDRPDDAFLLVHDTNLDNMVGSAISMQRLPEFLEWRAGSAGNLLLLVDACHSGNIAFPGKRGFVKGKDDVARASVVIDNLNKAVDGKKGWGAISATAPDQLAGESTASCELGGKPYAGGIFTCNVLSGLSGNADGNADGRVTLSEVYEYTKAQVNLASDGAQSPQLSGSLDLDVEMSIPATQQVAIPVVPERYLLESDPHALRPWIWVSAGLTTAALGGALAFNLAANVAADELNKDVADTPGGLTSATWADRNAEVDSLQLTALIGYIATGSLAAMTATLAGWDLLDAPQDINDVYGLPPWFEITIQTTVKGQGAALNLKVEY